MLRVGLGLAMLALLAVEWVSCAGIGTENVDVVVAIISPALYERFEAGNAIAFVIEVAGAVRNCFFARYVHML